MEPQNLKELFEPQTIAVIGASRSPGKVGHELVANLINGGFAGRIVPVNPSATEVLGLPCVADLAKAKIKVDLALVAVPTARVADAIRGAARAGAKAAVVVTAGFKEVGEAGAVLEQEVLKVCQEYGVGLMGPNCIGLINTHHRMNATFASSLPRPGSISVISQSGALCVAILDWAAARGIGFAKVVSFGNKADLDETDFLQALADDDATKVIAGYLESITDGDAFLREAERAADKKPVVILKVGTTKAGAKAASSHTGSLAGADMAYGAAFRRTGVIRAEGFEALFDYSLAFATQPLPTGRRVAVITNAGGPGIMAADAIESMDMVMAPLSEATRAKLAEGLPATAATGNPVDVIGDADPERYFHAFEILQDDPEVDALMILATPQNMTQPLALAEGLAARHHGKKPLVTAFLGGRDMQDAIARLTDLGIPNYDSPSRAVRTLRAMAEYAAWRERPVRVVTRFPVNRRRVERVLTWHRRMGIGQVGEVEAKEILRAYDFRVLPGSLATTADQAVETAARIGYPVVLKISSPEIIHKSDFGGVRVNLSTPEQVRDAFDLMMLRVRRRAPEARIRGAFVEQMGPRGREVILGMTRDPQFGPMLMFGLGGIFVEVMKDVTFHLAPITSQEALQMLKSTRSYALLEGARGQAPVDLDAVAEALQRISQLATDYKEIQELDINPFIVGGLGSPAYVADARMSIRLHGEGDTP